MRFQANTKSCAVTGVPSDHFASLRSLNVQVFPSSETVWDSATPGTTSLSAEIPSVVGPGMYSPSKMLNAMRPSGAPDIFEGSKVSGSAASAMVK